MRSSKRKSGSLALKIGLASGGAAAVVAALGTAFVVPTMSAAISSQHADIVTRGWIIGLALAVIAGVVGGLVAYFQAGAIASRLTELGLSVAKVGRGTSEVRIRHVGNDEVGALGRAIQFLAADLAAMHQEAEQGGTVSASFDPLVRELRDRTVPDGFDEVEGFEVDGAMSAGSRGGTDYFDCVVSDEVAVMFLVAAEGVGATSAIAAKMARDEIMRALKANASARKALAHTNRVLHKQLPSGVCAKATLVSLTEDEVKLYHCGMRSPLLVCSAGRVQEVHGEGLALGLDEGPVFEKGLRSVAVPVSQGVRLVVANEGALRLDDFTDLVSEHSPKHTAPFMNLVLGSLESNAGDAGLREDVVLMTAKRW